MLKVQIKVEPSFERKTALQEKAANAIYQSGENQGSLGKQNQQPQSRPIVSNVEKIGRNDPCPCGAINPQTSKPYKYKKCGLINAPYHKG